jgi:hypothetical protein
MLNVAYREGCIFEQLNFRCVCDDSFYNFSPVKWQTGKETRIYTAFCFIFAELVMQMGERKFPYKVVLGGELNERQN